MESLKEKFVKIRKDQWMLFLLVGILLAVIALPSEDTEEKRKSTEEFVQTTISQKDAMTDLENRLQNILSQLEGAGRVQVMITQKSSGEKIVEKDTPVSDRNTQEEDEGGSRSTVEKDMDEVTVYEKDENGNQTPYVTQETAPKVEGVLVLAEGGDNAVVIKNITDAVMALFGLEAHKIKVMKMN